MKGPPFYLLQQVAEVLAEVKCMRCEFSRVKYYRVRVPEKPPTGGLRAHIYLGRD